MCAVLAATPTCALGVPFENARRAYYADKTWPKELRRNYTSPTNALLRIPIEEGPYYLFRGGFPLAMSNWAFWTTYLSIYSFLKNKTFFFHLYFDFHYDLIKAQNMAIAFMFGSIMGYPAYHVREMVDLWPKERGGHCTWNNSYRECWRWMGQEMDFLYYNFLSGYWGWFRRYGAIYLISLWTADSLGMFTNCNEAFNSLEQTFAFQAESS